MKSILLHINDDEALEARKQVALDLARGFEGHLTCLQAVSFEMFAPGDFYGSAMAVALPAIKEAAEELRKRMEADLSNEGVSWEWLFLYGMAEHRLLDYSPLNDIIVVGPRDIGESESRPSHLVSDLVLRSRTPVMVVPKDQKGFDIESPACIAWNGSSEACIAMRASLPLLQRASKVYMISVSEKKDSERFDFPPTDGAKYLARHDVDVELVEVPHRDRDEPVADILFDAAQARDCGYMVMGAYGHSRLAEMLLGGVTRRALANPRLPMIMAH